MLEAVAFFMVAGLIWLMVITILSALDDWWY
jgi:hypothetical protein